MYTEILKMAIGLVGKEAMNAANQKVAALVDNVHEGVEDIVEIILHGEMDRRFLDFLGDVLVPLFLFLILAGAGALVVLIFGNGQSTRIIGASLVLLAATQGAYSLFSGVLRVRIPIAEFVALRFSVHRTIRAALYGIFLEKLRRPEFEKILKLATSLSHAYGRESTRADLAFRWASKLEPMATRRAALRIVMVIFPILIAGSFYRWIVFPAIIRAAYGNNLGWFDLIILPIAALIDFVFGTGLVGWLER